MRLPYNMMSDSDIMALPIGSLQKDGLIFLWITSRAFSIGIECLESWGFVLPRTVAYFFSNPPTH